MQARFPQGPMVDQGLFVTLEWQQWLQNPQFISFSFASPITVTSGGTGLSVGTSGGIPAFTSANTMASSGLLSANQIVVGGGAGATPSTPIGSTGTATTLLHGNATGAPSWSAVSLTADVSGILPVANGGTGFTAGPSQLTHSLSADVTLNNTGTYFDGPSISQGTSGTWWVSGIVTVADSGGSSSFNAKLWDGSTVIASARTATNGTSNMTISLSGFISGPAGDLRISVNDSGATTGKILFNASGNSKDSTISAFRIA